MLTVEVLALKGPATWTSGLEPVECQRVTVLPLKLMS